MAEQVFRDILYGLRSMRRSLAFTVIAVVTLALGVGATTAIFSVVALFCSGHCRTTILPGWSGFTME